jgi:hypothetical protein
VITHCFFALTIGVMTKGVHKVKLLLSALRFGN